MGPGLRSLRARTARLVGIWAVAAVLAGAAVASGAPAAGARGARGGRIAAVGAENEYANVISQLGGRYVKVYAVMRNPNTDPHTFEASTRVAQLVASAQLVVQNGLGYDPFMNTIEAASPDPARKVVEVQSLLHLKSTTKNPHVWYSPTTMPAVAKAIAGDLGALAPVHRAYFESRLRAFDASLGPWRTAIRRLRERYKGTPVATTEPVADDMLQAAGIVDKTPWPFQADVMNGIDPSPQYTAYEEKLLRTHLVKAFVYNHQVTDSLTTSLLRDAEAAHVPIVGVYETMPTPGYDYQRWMVAEVDALANALAHRTSSEKL